MLIMYGYRIAQWTERPFEVGTVRGSPVPKDLFKQIQIAIPAFAGWRQRKLRRLVSGNTRAVERYIERTNKRRCKSTHHKSLTLNRRIRTRTESIKIPDNGRNYGVRARKCKTDLSQLPVGR